jgi:hypothetical protein
MTMTRAIWGSAAVAALLMTVAACRQPEGTMPKPQGEQVNRVEDITQDLRNVARKDAQAPGELLDDLTYLDPAPRPPDRLKAVADAVSAAIAGKTLGEPEARKVADLLFASIALRDLSQDQIEQVGVELRDALVTVGADAPAAERASTAAMALASDVTQNKKKWYQR